MDEGFASITLERHMTTREALLELLRKQKEARSSPPPETWSEVKAEWLESLGRLMDRLYEFLAPAVGENLVGIFKYKVSINERADEEYEAPALRIQGPSGAVVDVVPVARYVEGALGRVDVVRGASRTILARFACDEWAFMKRAPGTDAWTRTELKEASFSEVLLELIR